MRVFQVHLASIYSSLKIRAPSDYDIVALDQEGRYLSYFYRQLGVRKTLPPV